VTSALLAWLRVGAELTKFRISAMATLTTATGFLIFSRRVVPELWTCVVGTLLTAAAACTFNQLQEQRYDARMARTGARPLPAGRVDRPTAALLGVVLAGLGLASLATAPANPLLVLALGAFALLWYNGVYSYLKRVTAFAVVPGALIGALPPVIGWCAAGGSLSDSTIWLVAGSFFIWQVPHFWLLALRHDADFRRSGWPVLSDTFALPQLRRITFVWIVATSVAAIMAAGLVSPSLPAMAGLAAGSLWLAVGSGGLLKSGSEAEELSAAFVRINAFAVAFCALLALSAIAG
jgi:protoheme IX farnesyltransferase